MIDMSPFVLQSLESNASIVALVGRDQDDNIRIYQHRAPYADDFPRITFFEMTNFDSSYADDDASQSTISYQVDVWSKGDTAAIAKEVDKSMKALGFRRTSSVDLYEDDVQVYHKGLRYTIAVEAAQEE